MQVTLGKTEMKVNPVGFGGIPVQRLTPKESDRVVGAAVEEGINFFDTARGYTDSEEKLGRVLSQYPRHKLVIASKTMARDGATATADLDTALKLLKTDYIDLYQCHNVRCGEDIDALTAPGGALEVFQKARKEGKIRHIGVTGHKPPVLLKVIEVFDFATLQVPVNYIEQAALEELVPRARAKNMGVIAMKPVAGGGFKHVPAALRFILANGVDVVIPGMDDVRQVKENFSILRNTDPLSEGEIALLEKEKEQLGDEFCRRCDYCQDCPEGLPISFLHVLRTYFYRYNLQDWSLDRVNALPKAYKDCTGCGLCVAKCPYDLDMPRIFRETWKDMSAYR